MSNKRRTHSPGFKPKSLLSQSGPMKHRMSYRRDLGLIPKWLWSGRNNCQTVHTRCLPLEKVWHLTGIPRSRFFSPRLAR